MSTTCGWLFQPRELYPITTSDSDNTTKSVQAWQAISPFACCSRSSSLEHPVRFLKPLSSYIPILQRPQGYRRYGISDHGCHITEVCWWCSCTSILLPHWVSKEGRLTRRFRGLMRLRNTPRHKLAMQSVCHHPHGL